MISRTVKISNHDFFQLRISDTDDENVELVNRGVKYTKEASAVKPLQFDLGPLIVKMNKNKTALTVNIHLNRIYNNHLATTFFPTTCLLIIACFTLFIGPDHFEVNIALALTTMLVMQTLHENISQDVPKTAYLKLVDWWLIYGMLVPFLVFMVLGVIEMLPKENSLENNATAGRGLSHTGSAKGWQKKIK